MLLHVRRLLELLSKKLHVMVSKMVIKAQMASFASNENGVGDYYSVCDLVFRESKMVDRKPNNFWNAKWMEILISAKRITNQSAKIIDDFFKRF